MAGIHVKPAMEKVGLFLGRTKMITEIAHTYPKGYVDIAIGPVDLELLERQRNILLDLIWDDSDNDLWGLIEMLNDMIDLRE
jgi:hypothetical protein